MSNAFASREIAGNRSASLDEVLTYRHPGVVARYLREFGGGQNAAEELFGELMRWLYLCGRASEPGASRAKVSMYPEILQIDDMWHIFVLHTRDYAHFCARYFGRFIHHDPAPIDRSREPSKDEVNSELAAFLSLLYDELGEPTVRRWFAEGRFARGASPTEPR